MSRIRQMRIERGLSQKQLAELLNTTQQTIGRWETGKVQPSVSSLRDMALHFGCRVNDLLDDVDLVAEFGAPLPDFDEGFWGHVGALLPSQEFTKWYPISLAEADRIRDQFRHKPESTNWIVVSTLNNRLLFIQMSKLKRLWILDDDADQPNDDWEIDHLEYAGLSPEIYWGLDEWASGSLDKRASEGEVSEAFVSAVKEIAEQYGESPDGVMDKLHECSIFHVDGSVTTYWPEPSVLSNLRDICLLDGMPKVLPLPGNAGFESYFHEDGISMVEAPLLGVLEYDDYVLSRLRQEMAAQE